MERKYLPDFEALERQSQTLVKHIVDVHGVPTIQRNIAQLDAVSRKLARAAPQGVDMDVEAQAYVE